jgi:anaerobic ribonucleoside-triphosphate reductase
VQTSHDSCLPFKKRKIVDTLLKETEVKEPEAWKIARSVERQVKKIEGETITTPQIREMVNEKLMERGMVNEARQHQRLGVPIADIKDLIKGHNVDNANIGKNPEAVHKYGADKVFKQLALMCLPSDIAKAHDSGDLHIHDLEFLAARPLNCLQSDLRIPIRYGLKVDGTGQHTSAAGPAKNIETLVNHAGQLMMAAQVYMSGGQSLSLINVFMAPYARGLPYERVKQAIQMFIFNLNMSYVSRGGQAVFSSVNIEFTVPNFLKNEPAYGPGGKVVGTYGDYEEEVRILNHAFIDVMMEGDCMGKPHLFPNSIWVLRKEMMKKEFEDDLLKVHELSAKYSVPYFANCLPDWTGGHSNVMGSMSYDTPILLKIEGEKQLGKAGDFFSEVPKTDDIKVMTYNGNGEISWEKVKTIIEKPPVPIIKIRARNGRTIKVTANHKIPIKRDGVYQKIKSDDLKIGDELYEFNLNKISKYEDLPEYEFLGMFLADGYIRRAETNKGRRNGLNIEFHLKKEWKLKQLLLVLDKLEYKYDLIEKKDTTYTVYVREEKIRHEYVKYYKGSEKLFPVQYLEEPQKLANIIKGLCLDATQVKNKKMMFSSSNENIALGFMLGLDFLGIRHSHHVDIRYNWAPNYQISFGHNPLPSKIKEIIVEENNYPVYDLEIENNHNYVCGWGNIHVENCRTRLNNNWGDSWDEATLRTGNLAYVTLNLPRISYKMVKENKSFYGELDRVLGLAEEMLLIRRGQALKCLNKHKLLSFLTQKNDGEEYYRIDNSTLSFGFVGMDEAIKAMGISDGIVSKEGQKIAKEILEYMNNYAKELTDETEYRWTVLQTPAETTAHRFAILDKKRYPDLAMVKGEENSYYYSNSSHVPVDSKLLLTQKIKIESQFHPLTSGGNIFHAFLEEAHPQPEALMNLTKKVAKTDLGFWAYTSAFSYCFGCNQFMKGLKERCHHCGSVDDVECYSRITGYLQQVGNKKDSSGGWNAGKKQELKDRHEGKI